MNIQTKERLRIMKEMLEDGKTLEVGVVHHRITEGISLDFDKKLNPDILCDLNYDSIPLENKSFDVVVAGEVLEHLINPYRIVREFYRILKPNGIIIISVPNISSLVSRIRGLFGKLPTSCCLPSDENKLGKHINDFNIDILKDVLKKLNFKIEEITSNGLITNSRLITKNIPASMGETLIIKARKQFALHEKGDVE